MPEFKPLTAGDLFAVREGQGIVAMTPGASEMSDEAQKLAPKPNPDSPPKTKTTTTMRKK